MANVQYAFYFFVATDTHVLLADACFKETSPIRECPTLVLQHVSNELGGLKRRRVFYRDSKMWFEELRHQEGQFLGFGPASQTQQLHFARLIEKHALLDAQLMTNF